MDSMYMYLARMADRLEQAAFDRADVALAITELQEKHLLQEIEANSNVRVHTAHHSEFMGWRIIVKGRQ